MAVKFKFDGLKESPLRIARQLERSQYWDRNKIESYQLSKINDIVQESRGNVPYYMEKKYDGYEKIKSLDIFDNDYPVLTKESLIESNERFKSKKKIKRFVHSTSGSTGTPMKFEISDLAVSYRIANNFRFYKWWGINMLDNNVLIWKKIPRKKNLRFVLKELEKYFLGKLVLNVFELNEDTYLNFTQSIERHKPKYIRGYKSGVYELARLMDKNGIKLNIKELKLVVVTSEILFENERNFMESVFNCKVANEYGAADGGLFALECPEGSMHLNEESVYVTTDLANNAKITEFFNNSMPLVNYKNNDKVIFSHKTCSCERNLKVIQSVHGRSNDVLIYPDGKIVHSYILAMIVVEFSNRNDGCVKQFKWIQKRTDLTLLLVLSIEINNELEAQLLELTKKKLSDIFKLHVDQVDSINREKSGKLSFFDRIEPD